ncbi:MAG TPA: hypothetical protein VJ732_01565 [Bryobacteraceae bacterium]|nr:hypothetical protein [Bryobacteraceae bacterium]
MKRYSVLLLAAFAAVLERLSPSPPEASLTSGEPLPEGWHRPEPERLPHPTYWPAVLALGVVLLVWGPITTLAVSAVGGAVIVVGLTGWLGDLLHEP